MLGKKGAVAASQPLRDRASLAYFTHVLPLTQHRSNQPCKINFRTFQQLTVMTTTTLNLNPVIQLSKEQFYTLCATNPDTKLELNANGELIVMSPTGGETSAWNAELIIDLGVWNRQTGLGKTFDSSGGFALPNGAQRSPDVAWIPLEKWNALTTEEKKGFLPLCPDFVMELLSPSDAWKQGIEKMEEYKENGCRLGWLIEPRNKRVAIYRAKQAVEILEAPNFLSGEDVLKGFNLNLAKIWR